MQYGLFGHESLSQILLPFFETIKHGLLDDDTLLDMGEAFSNDCNLLPPIAFVFTLVSLQWDLPYWLVFLTISHRILD